MIIQYGHEGGGFTARMGEPFAAVTYEPGRDAGWCRIHPRLTRLPGGRLLLSTNIHGDIEGHGSALYCSDDGGQTWNAWSDGPHGGAMPHCVLLGDGTTLGVSGGDFFSTGLDHAYHWGVQRSVDGGSTWSALEFARVYQEPDLELPAAYNPLQPPHDVLAERRDWAHLSRFPPDWQALGRNPEPNRHEKGLWEALGSNCIPAYITCLLPLGGTEVLAFLYLSPRPGQPCLTLCLGSEDGGRTWWQRSMPGPPDQRFAIHGYLRHASDGLCEPSCTRLPTGELFLVMRRGSYHPLYTAISSDSGFSWNPQADLRPGCYYAGWPARPISVHGILPTILTLPDGTLALCTGRPDVTLSFSFDHGYHWPCTLRLLEDNKPEEQSSCNNAMIEVAPGRLLVMYDHGSNSGKSPEYHGPQQITGVFVDVE